MTAATKQQKVLWSRDNACSSKGLAPPAWKKLEKMDGFPPPVEVRDGEPWWDEAELSPWIDAHRRP